MNEKKPVNIFQISASNQFLEDKFTAGLHYLIDNIPAIGQSIVDAITKTAGVTTSQFLSAEDHPEGDAENKPDFLLRCADFDILCEHKLESDLGKSQLERYLKLKRGRPTHLVLITNRSHAIPDAVLGESQYLRPVDSHAAYFAWEQLYPCIANRPERLAREFAAHMQELGMSPSPLPKDWAHIFTHRETAEAFYDRTKEMRALFLQMGAQCRRDESRLAFQVRYPLPWLHLLYFYVSRSATPTMSNISPPYICANVWVKRSDINVLARFADRNDQLVTEHGLIIGRGKSEIARWDKELSLAYECVSGLENYLTEDVSETRARLLGFGTTVFEQIRNIAK